MNSQAVSQVSRTGDRTRTPSGSSKRVLLAAAGLAVLAPAALAGGRSAWGVSVGVASGGTFVGGSYRSGGFYGGRGYCPPAPVCAPRPYCAPVARPYWGGGWGGWGPRPYYGGWRPYCPPPVAVCPPPVIVPPTPVCVTSSPSWSVGVGVAGSNGAGFVSYSSAPAIVASPVPVYTTPVVTPVVYSAPAQVVTFTNPNPTTVIETSPPAQTQVVQQAAPQPAPQPVAQQAPATVFQSSGASGVLERGSSPASVISVVRAETGDARAQAAEAYLGRTPGQAWPVQIEGIQESGGVKEIRCRAIDSLSNGYKPTIIVRGAGESNLPPRQARGFVTGRIVAISVDDPAYPGGLIVIDEGWVKW
ncbi:MAG: hypothetical protein U0570_02590 [Phycisphaerales bacterium]